MQDISPSTVFKINAPRVAHETIHGETIIIDFESGSYYSTDKAGAMIWEHIDRGASVGELLHAVRQHYDGDPSDIESAVTRFVMELQKEVLIAPTHPEASAHDLRSTGNSADRPSAVRPPFQAPALFKYTDMQDLLLLDPIHDVDEQGWPVKKQ